MIQAFIIAFSMYSKIPMPNVVWNEKNIKYAFCFFPLIGAIEGIVLYFAMWLCYFAGMGKLFSACIATVIPIFITGGIHLDGYLDTVDAINSFAEKEKRLEILKDPNAGAFAIIYGAVYFILSIAVWSEIEFNAIIYICISYMVSRSLSALSVVSFPLAKNTGLASTFKNNAHKNIIKIVMIFYFILEISLLIFLNTFAGLLIMAISLACYILHYRLCINKFGGITGDLAGFFLQICELAILIGIFVLFKLNC